MSILFSIKLRNLRKLLLHHKSEFLKQCDRNSIKQYAKLSVHEKKENATDQRHSFHNVMEFRRSEADKSLLIQVQSPKSYKELHAYCSTLGSVKQMLHYTLGPEPLHFIIVEFDRKTDMKGIFSNATYPDDSQIVPVHSTFLWFRMSHKNNKLKASAEANLNIENGTKSISNEALSTILKESENISDQMTNLYDNTKLNDVGIRLRFLAAKQVETALHGMFPSAVAYPFGSTVNGYGKMGCDLDLVLRLNQRCVNSESRLVFHSKATNGSERATSQRHMEAVGDILQLFLPGCTQVRKILQARVPIIKYYQLLLDVECDLSMSNLSGLHMSDFLYMMGSIDDRVRPLVFTIRKWAAAVGLTNNSPGRWITNFPLTLLVLYFLQTQKILPTLKTLTEMAGPKDKHVTEEGVNCTFLRDINKYLASYPPTNRETLKELLCSFYAFYINFDFKTNAVCLCDGMAKPKPDNSPMYIVNPLERGLNVSKNVSIEELERFKTEASNAVWILEADNVKTSYWGIIPLFDVKKGVAHLKTSKSSKLLEVSALFHEDPNNPDLKVNNKSGQTMRYSPYRVTKRLR